MLDPLLRTVEPPFLFFDELIAGRRSRVLLAVALYQALIAPSLDRSLGALGDMASFSTVARSVGQVEFAGFPFFSLTGGIILLVVTSLVIGGRIMAFRAGAREAGGGGGLSDAWLVVRTELRRSNAHPLPLTQHEARGARLPKQIASAHPRGVA